MAGRAEAAGAGQGPLGAARAAAVMGAPVAVARGHRVAAAAAVGRMVGGWEGLGALLAEGWAG